jgi:hypothetical protein
MPSGCGPAEQALRSPTRHQTHRHRATLLALLAVGLTLGLGIEVRPILPDVAHAASRNLASGHAVAQSSEVSIREGVPADVFMQAIISYNGQVAWDQLCPATKKAISPAELATLVDARWPAGAQRPAQVTVDFVGAHAWGGTDQIRIYVVTGHWASGVNADTLFVVRTQADGCVYGV